MDTRKILEQFYPRIFLPEFQPRQSRLFRSKGNSVAKNWPRYLATRTWSHRLVISSLIITVWAAAHLYYYNMLVNLECNTQAAWAQVETQLQRRFYIQQNLTKMIIDYSEYEKDLLTNLTKMRTSTMGSNLADKAKNTNQQPPAESSNLSPLPQVKQITPVQLDKLFSNILLVAEQYPQLKLTENFQQFSTVIVDVETRIAERIMGYNDAVNAYTTTLSQFPGNIFGVLCGFHAYKFYTPDKEVLDFSPVKY